MNTNLEHDIMTNEHGLADNINRPISYSALPEKHYRDQGINPALMGLWADLCDHFLEEYSTATNMLCSSWAFLGAEVVFSCLDDTVNESLAQECKKHFNDGYAEKLAANKG